MDGKGGKFLKGALIMVGAYALATGLEHIADKSKIQELEKLVENADVDGIKALETKLIGEHSDGKQRYVPAEHGEHSEHDKEREEYERLKKKFESGGAENAYNEPHSYAYNEFRQ